jgi:diacylglycerol kinase (ATP)
MRAAAIFGLGSSTRNLRVFQENSSVEWIIGLPGEQESVDAILVFGGDGTVHRHLGGLVPRRVPVLVVPAGSGNDFARALGIRGVHDSVGAWTRFASGGTNCRTIDLGMITPTGPGRSREIKATYFSCAAGVGLDGEVTRRANGLPRWLKARGGYALSFPGALASFQPFLLTMRADAGEGGGSGSQAVRRVMAAVFANAPFYGGGMEVAPRALMDDGMLDVCLIRAMAKMKLLGLFPSVYFGRHLGIEGVEYFSTARSVVETDRTLDVYADGEYVCETPAEFRAARSVLRVIVP